jgi:HK97 gp10 family phage protein
LASDFDLEGLTAIGKFLKAFPEVIQARVLDGGMKAAADAMVEPLQRAAPVFSGRLELSIASKKNSFRSNARRSRATGVLEVSSVVLLRYPGKRYWHFTEFGTSKMPARPWVRPTFAANQGRVVEVVKAYVGRRTIGEARRLAVAVLAAGGGIRG